MSLPYLLTHLSADGAVLLLTLGMALIYFELNRPGTILPGAIGLFLTLVSLACLSRNGLNPLGIAWILLAVALMALDLLRPTPIPVSIFATAALVLGLRWLPAQSFCFSVSTPVALGCGAALGAATSLLTRIARRARTNKRVRLWRDQNRSKSIGT